MVWRCLQGLEEDLGCPWQSSLAVLPAEEKCILVEGLEVLTLISLIKSLPWSPGQGEPVSHSLASHACTPTHYAVVMKSRGTCPVLVKIKEQLSPGSPSVGRLSLDLIYQTPASMTIAGDSGCWPLPEWGRLEVQVDLICVWISFLFRLKAN